MPSPRRRPEAPSVASGSFPVEVALAGTSELGPSNSEPSTAPVGKVVKKTSRCTLVHWDDDSTDDEALYEDFLHAVHCGNVAEARRLEDRGAYIESLMEVATFRGVDEATFNTLFEMQDTVYDACCVYSWVLAGVQRCANEPDHVYAAAESYAKEFHKRIEDKFGVHEGA